MKHTNSQKRFAINNYFGFRNIYVRIRNQLDYSLFNVIHEGDIVAGKQGYLFETHYIDGIYGNDFLGTPALKKRVERLKFISDTLAAMGKKLIVVIAPNKVLFYPEYAPEYPFPFRDTTNYEVYTKLLKSNGMNFIDFNSYFNSQKNKSPYPLMPKNGIHWSMYGAGVAGDSLIKYIETLCNIRMPKAVWKSIRVQQDSTYDIDAEKSISLLFKVGGPLMAYPHIEFEKDSTKIKPTVLTIGDSFYIEFLSGYDIQNGFSLGSTYWYYFKKFDHSTPTRDELRDQLSKSDVVMFMATENSLINLGWGAIDSAYYMFKGTYPSHIKSTIYSERMAQIIEEIKTNNVWLRQVEQNAYQQNEPLDSALKANARWTIEHESK